MTNVDDAPRTEPDDVGAVPDAAAREIPPEIVAQSMGEYVRGAWARMRAGDTGVLPVVAGLVVISALFQALDSRFLTAANLVNLLIQGAVYMLLAMGVIFALLLGEIDLSVGFVAGIGGTIMAELVKQQTGWPWWAAIAVALLTCAAIGVVHGTIITRLGLPSFVVTLAGLLGWQGVMLLLLGTGGTLPINDRTINNFASGNLSPIASWIVIGAIVAGFGVHMWFRDERRRRSGLVAPPASVTLSKIGLAAAAGIALVLICNTNRGRLIAIRGVPWVVLIVLAVLGAWTFLLGRTKPGRYMYAIGGNTEAARRAGVNVNLIRTSAFMLASFTAGIAGIVYASRLRSMSTAFDGGTLVLYAVGAAVIGGTSLFGGRGKAIHGVLGGLVIAAIDNGMGLQGYSAAAKYVVTAIVLLAAVALDSFAHRGRVLR